MKRIIPQTETDEEDALINAFSEEFDNDDVIGSKSDEQLQNEGKNSDDYQKKGKSGKSDSSAIRSDNSLYQELLRSSFQDFNVMKNLEGVRRSFSSSRIPAENITDSGKSIAIEDTTSHSSNHNINPQTTVLFHRDENDDVTQIEIICSCGEKTIIDLEFE